MEKVRDVLIARRQKSSRVLLIFNCGLTFYGLGMGVTGFPLLPCFAVFVRVIIDDVQLKFRVTPEERELIEQKMAQLGTENMAAYLRKMAIDGLVVKLELPELRELVSLLRYSSNNLNQLTRRVHETGRVYDADLEDLRQGYDRLWEAANKILTSLAAIQ